MTIQRAAGFTALASFIAMIALLVAIIVHIMSAPVLGQDRTVGVITLTEAPSIRDISFTSQSLAVLEQLDAGWDIRRARAMTYEALEDVPIVVVVLRRPLAYSEAIDLDAWVRDGGRALILAEPGRSWAAPGDAVDANLREATHGLRLATRADGPMGLPGGGTLMLRNAGRWVKSTTCTLRHDDFLADCRPGKGRMVLVGDTGLLDRSGYDLNGESFANATRMTGMLIEAVADGQSIPVSFAEGDQRYSPPQPPMMVFIAMGGLFWVAVGALAVWGIMQAAAKKSRPRPSGPARIVRDGQAEPE